MSPRSSDVDVTLAQASERVLIEGLFQFYIYDFSELEPAASEDFEPGPDGRFAAYPHLDSYWSDKTCTPLIIRRDGRPAGFALMVERNTAGRAFWPTAIAATPGVTGLITLQGDGVHWTGPILSFTVRP